MQGYPKIVATKQDYINLLSISEYKEQALIDLQSIVNFSDDIVKKYIDKDSYIEIANPNPIYKQKGFATRQEIIDIITKLSNRINQPI